MQDKFIMMWIPNLKMSSEKSSKLFYLLFFCSLYFNNLLSYDMVILININIYRKCIHVSISRILLGRERRFLFAAKTYSF